MRDLFATAAGIGNDSLFSELLGAVTQPSVGETHPFEPWQLSAVAGALDSLARQGKTGARLPQEVRAAIEPVISFARKASESGETSEADLLAAIPNLGRAAASRGDDIKRLAGLTAASRPAAVQIAAVAALARISDAKVPPALIPAWGGASPILRTRILDALLGRAAWHGELLAAIEKGKIPAGQIDAARRRRLTNAANEETRTRAEKLFAGSTNPDRQKVIDEYKSVLDLKSNPEIGKIVFAKSCAPCHAFGGTGHAVGPDLASLPNKSPLYLLTEILDPSRNLDSRYAEYQATLKDGRLVSGLLAAETATSITLRGQQAKDETILRSDIDNLRGTAKSLMPEGLEKEIPKQDFANLIAYLTSAEPSEKKPDAAAMAKQILDDSMPREKREALAKETAAHAAEVIRAMTADLPNDPKEEYRRIPWIWRVAIAAGRANDAKVLAGLIDLSLPKPGAKLRDWQAVVLGGGVINGLSLEGVWPGRRVAELIRDHPELEQAWREGLKQTHAMADDEKVRPGTRYDALRIVALDDWKAARPRLGKYLAKDANAELQMGAVSGLLDVENAEATAHLIQALPDLTERNRTLALAGLVRGRERIAALLDAIEAGKVKPDWLAKEHREALLKHRDEVVRTRAAKLLKP
jgi:putative heme-binding domain-containing protein